MKKALLCLLLLLFSAGAYARDGYQYQNPDYEYAASKVESWSLLDWKDIPDSYFFVEGETRRKNYQPETFQDRRHLFEAAETAYKSQEHRGEKDFNAVYNFASLLSKMPNDDVPGLSGVFKEPNPEHTRQIYEELFLLKADDRKWQKYLHTDMHMGTFLALLRGSPHDAENDIMSMDEYYKRTGYTSSKYAQCPYFYYLQYRVNKQRDIAYDYLQNAEWLDSLLSGEERRATVGYGDVCPVCRILGAKFSVCEWVCEDFDKAEQQMRDVYQEQLEEDISEHLRSMVQKSQEAEKNAPALKRRKHSGRN